jgi:hypothetical protein
MGNLHVVDLDGSVSRQSLVRRQADCVDLREWGPHVRLGCSHGRFAHFAGELHGALPEPKGGDVVFLGSGDFHHVTLALLQRRTQPVNLLVLDKHPDWMRGLPFMHCGTWLWHAARLPQVRQIFHAGGDLDFDNRYRWLAPWPLLRSGKITVFPAARYFRRGRWSQIAHEPLRPNPFTAVTPARLEYLLEPLRDELRRYPLYVSLDKDVLREEDAVVNWDSGFLTLREAQDVLRAFAAAAGFRLAGLDMVGDWSPVRTQGLFRRLLHWTEHPPLTVDPDHARLRNEQTNLALLQTWKAMTSTDAQKLPLRRDRAVAAIAV